MATRGSIPKMMELAGIDMLPPEAGVPLIRRELTAGATRGEVIIGQRLGVLTNEWGPNGGPVAGTNAAAHGPMVVPTVKQMGIYQPLVVETTLDPKMQPFLYDHQIDGTPVLPGVMGIEAFAEAALLMLPGWQIEAVEAVHFLAPFKFYRSEPRTLTLETVHSPQDGHIIAECRLMGRRVLPNHAEPQVTTHFTGRVRMTRKPLAASIGPRPAMLTGDVIEAAEVYRLYFHGPAYQVLKRAWRDGERVLGEMAGSLPPNHKPAGQPALMAPRLIELCFQTAGLWEMGVQHRMGLPQQVERVQLLRAPELAHGSLFAVVTPRADGASFDAQVVDSAGNQYAQLTGYRTVALPNVIDFEALRAMRAAA
jgi:hypothetical protein